MLCVTFSIKFDESGYFDFKLNSGQESLICNLKPWLSQLVLNLTAKSNIS